MKISNMLNSVGNSVKNQFIIEDDNNCSFFQSYKTIIVKKNLKTGVIQLDKNSWDYSVTTSKYRNLFLSTDSKQLKKDIKSGLYELVDLNK